MKNSALLKFTKLNELTAKQKAAIPHLIGARNLEEGSRSARISKVTLYQWLNNPAFKKALDDGREAIIEEGLARLKGAVSMAVSGLLELCEDPEKNIKLRACDKILDFFLRSREIEDVLRRLERIEESLNEK